MLLGAEGDCITGKADDLGTFMLDAIRGSGPVSSASYKTVAFTYHIHSMSFSQRKEKGTSAPGVRAGCQRPVYRIEEQRLQAHSCLRAAAIQAVTLFRNSGKTVKGAGVLFRSQPTPISTVTDVMNPALRAFPPAHRVHTTTAIAQSPSG